ncbi:IS3 family transposase [Streptococcus dysgalactiae]
MLTLTSTTSITFYNETRIQQRLNDQSPVQYRKLIA